METKIIIGGVLLLLFLLVFFINFSKKTENIFSECQTDSDCSSDEKCLENRCIEKTNSSKSCGVENLTACDFTDGNSCKDCEGEIKFSCLVVDDTHPFSYYTNEGKKIVPNSLPNQGWCLPNVDTTEKCNPFTSDVILMRTLNNDYEWGCSCKYPNLFDHSEGIGSNCTFVRACGKSVDGNTNKFVVPNGKLCETNKDCEKNEYCLNTSDSNLPCGKLGIITGDGNGPKQCHSEWDGSSNPLLGRCVCMNNTQYSCVSEGNGSRYEMDCVENSCLNGDYTTENCNPEKCRKINGNCECCKCPVGKIRCPDDIPSGNSLLLNYCKNTGAACLPDPCDNGENGSGKWNGRFCECDSVSTAVEDENSIVGETCKNLCKTDNPCGNRGDCVVSNGVAICKNCKSPYSNENDKNCYCSSSIGKLYDQECCTDDDCAAGLYCNVHNPKGVSCGQPTNPLGQKYFTGLCKGTYSVENTTELCIQNLDTTPVSCGNELDGYCPHDNVCCEIGKNSFNCCPVKDGKCSADGLNCCPTDFPIITSAGCMSANGREMMCANKTNNKYSEYCKNSNFIKTLSR